MVAARTAPTIGPVGPSCGPHRRVIASLAANAASFVAGRLVAASWPDLLW
jgi:hypothetical protein